MPTYYDSKGKAHVLAGEIGRGGEGTVYFCEGNENLVAKIYHEPITDEKAEKLRLMAKNKNERLLKVAAWVVEVLHDKAENGKIVGFLMPKIKAKEIHELYSLKSRRQHFPHATWHYLVHASANLARAFYSLHRDSHVIGDVNHGNCVVLADGTVKLIDCDSFAISDENGKRFKCDVGVATHLPPELQFTNLSITERLKKHDNFALAVVIFQLLFLGRHPFAGTYLGNEDKSLEECIKEFRFAYADDAHLWKVKQPPGTLNLSDVSPRLATMFERAFLTEDRPGPREWVEALVDLSNNLAQCNINPGHRFFNQLITCPWCRIESQTGLMLFPFVFSEEQTGDKPQFNIFTIEKLIESIGKNRNLPAKLERPTIYKLPEPKPEIVESAKLQRNQQLVYVVGFFFGMIFLNLIFGIVAGTFVGFFVMLGIFAYISKESKNLQTDLLGQLNYAEDELSELEKKWNVLGSPNAFAGDIKSIKQQIGDYKNFQLSSGKNLKELEKEQKYRLLSNYLHSIRLEKTEIEGITTMQREKLVGKKVRTAADIEEKRLLYYYKVNKPLTEKLLRWRKSLEDNFEFDPDSPSLQRRKERFLEENNAKRQKIEETIENSIENLRKNSLQIETQQKHLFPQSEEIYKTIAQCKSNLNAVGDTSVALVSLILITFLVPFFGVAFSVGKPNKVNENYPIAETYDPPSSEANGIVIKDLDSGDKLSEEEMTADEMNNLEVPDYRITDKEIEELDYATRRKYSTNLVRQAIWKIKQRIRDYDSALTLVKIAKRVDKDDTIAFQQFGKTLYDEGLYKESLKFFEEIENLGDPTFIEKYIALNNLELKNFKEAKEKLISLVRKEATVFNYYKLGLAYKGLGEYDPAKRSFEYAIQLDDEDVDSYYELGIVLHKLKDKEEFNKQYSILLDLDEEKAAELLKNTYKLPPAKVSTENSERPNIKGEGDFDKVKTVPADGGGSGGGFGSGSGEGAGNGSGSGSGN